jgi:23S rRNA (guanosine2251-2'-O)-methyltransferase
MDQIYGLTPVLEALRARRRPIYKILIASGANQVRLHELTEAAHRLKIEIERCDRRALDQMTRHANHQGVVAMVASNQQSYLAADTILDSLGSLPLLVLLDGIEDPQNLGAIFRACEGAGVDGVFLPEHRAVGVNETVAKTSAGAVEYLQIARVTNLVPLIAELKERGIWVAGVERGTDNLYSSVDLNIPLALVFGSEGKGLRRLVREKCDMLVSIPMRGQLNSLNVSVAAGIVLFEVVRQRGVQVVTSSTLK